MYGRYRTRKHGNTHWTCHHGFLSLEAILWLHLEFSLVWGFHFAGGFSFLGSASDMWLSFVWWPISFSVDGLDALADVCIFCNYGCPYITIIYHQLPSLTIYHSPSVDLLQLFCLAMESEERDGLSVPLFSIRFQGLYLLHGQKVKDCNEACPRGSSQKMGVFYYPLVMTNIAKLTHLFIDDVPVKSDDFPLLCWITKGSMLYLNIYIYMYIYITGYN